jgi:hypothetical protein
MKVIGESGSLVHHNWSKDHRTHFLQRNCGKHSKSACFLTLCGTAGLHGTKWMLLPVIQCNLPYVKRIHGNGSRVALRIGWFPRTCGHHYLPTYPSWLILLSYLKEWVLSNKSHITDTLTKNNTNKVFNWNVRFLVCTMFYCTVLLFT